MDTQENKTENQKNKITVFFKEHWVLLTICILPLIVYFGNFWGTGLSGETGDWGDFGGYIGGIIGTIFAFGAFMLMKETLEVQKKEFNNQLKIFNQEQFEQTFFNLIKLIGEKQIEEKSDNKQSTIDYHIIYGLVKEIKKIIENYQNKCQKENNSEKVDIKEQIDSYINILKLQIKDKTHLELLDKIMKYGDENLRNYYKETHFCEFMDIDIIYENIEKYTKCFGQETFVGNQGLEERRSQQTNLNKEDYEKLYKPDGNNVTTNIAVLKNLAQNPGEENKDILEKLAKYKGNEEKEIHLNVANNPNATENALEILSKKEEEKEVRQAVASNGNTPQDTLKKLANDNEKEVRQAVADNISTSKDILKYLVFNEQEYSVRLSVMKHPEITTELREELLKKVNYDNEFCSIALNDKNLSGSCLIEILNKTDLTHIEKIMQQNNINEKVFEKIIEIFEKCNAIQIEDMIIFAKLLLLDKLYQYENVLKKLIYLYIDKCNFERNIYINSTKCEYLYYYLKHFDSKNSFAIINVALDYIDEKSIDSQRLQKIIENLGFFIGSAKHPDNRDLTDDMKKEIDEKINGIKKLDDTQKQKLINCFN